MLLFYNFIVKVLKTYPFHFTSISGPEADFFFLEADFSSEIKLVLFFVSSQISYYLYRHICVQVYIMQQLHTH